MKIYLAHAKTNYSSLKNGYVFGLREAEHVRVLHSFHFTDGLTLPIHPKEAAREDLPQPDKRPSVSD